MTGATSSATLCRVVALCGVLLLVAGGGGMPADAIAEQASEPAFTAAGGVDAGRYPSCALLPAGSVPCWGFGHSCNLFAIERDRTSCCIRSSR